jgi:hypothetical protein
VLRGTNEPAAAAERDVGSIAVVFNVLGVKANNLYIYADCMTL